MKSVKFFRMLPIAAVVLVLSSCSKDQVDTQISAVADDLMLQKSQQVAGADADALTLKCPGCGPIELKGCMEDCAQMTDSGEGAFPRTITIDYGTGCGDDKKHQKKGKVIITISADMLTPGAVRTVTFQDFFVGDRQISGTRILTNTNTEAVDNSIRFSYSEDITMTHKGKSHSSVSAGTRTWTAGFDTPDNRDDDVFEMTGSATMTCRDGNAMTREIVEPIVFNAACGHPVSGIVEMTDPKGGTRSINFGDGTCDSEATVTHDGETETVNLDEMCSGEHHHHHGRHHGNLKD